MRHCGNVVFFICTSCACKIGICMPSNFNWKEKILQEQVEQDSTECPLSQGSSTIRCWSARRVWPHPSTLRPPAWCCPCPSCQLPPPPSQPLPPFPGWVYQACCPPCRSFQEFQLCRALGCQGCQDYCLECQRCQQSNRENCWRCGEWGCGEPALVSRANWQSIPVLWWLGLPSLGKQTHWRPFALKKCAATAFWICLRSVCVCFWLQKIFRCLSVQHLQSSCWQDLGNCRSYVWSPFPSGVVWKEGEAKLLPFNEESDFPKALDLDVSKLRRHQMWKSEKLL